MTTPPELPAQAAATDPPAATAPSAATDPSAAADPPAAETPQAPAAEHPGVTGAAISRRRRFVAAASAALVIVAGAAGGVAGTSLAGSTSGATAAATASAGTVAVASGSALTLADVVREVEPSVVTIDVRAAQSDVLGSGVILSSDGLILTNNHVVATGGRLTVTLADGTTRSASLVGADASHDLALIRVSGAADLTAASLGTSTGLAVGDTVLAFGSPLGLEGTVTAGIVSAVNRTIQLEGRAQGGLLQTDAAINSGNSGGPLVDAAGDVIGIDVAIATADNADGNIGVGFAIPIDTVRTVLATIGGASILAQS